MAIFAHFKQDTADWWRRFWNQPDKSYRNFQLVFFLLAVHFIVPSISYALNWQGAIWSLAKLGRILGADQPYRLTEASYVWRVLAVANVFTIGFMCLLLMANVRRFYPVLLPLCVLKGCAALGFLVVYIWRYRFPAFLAVSIWDTINVLMFLYFAHTARWSLEDWTEQVLVPRLRLKQH